MTTFPTNPQEIFDKVAKHLLTQNEKCTFPRVPENSDEIFHLECVYRGPDGLMCAVGCLIPDEWYNHSIEGMPADLLLDYLQETYNIEIDEETIELIESLQCIHDTLEPEEWAYQLSVLGSEFKLDTSVINES